MKIAARLFSIVLIIGGLAMTVYARPPAAAGGPIKVIIDTDFLLPPQDDGLARALELNSPELKILGYTTVEGNGEVNQETAELLRELEIAGRSDIPVYQGANRPLVHVASDWAKTVFGKWWSDAPVVPFPGGFAKTHAQKESAVDFLIHTVDANPGQITIFADGAMTNIAMAIRQDHDFARNAKKLDIMGGAIGSLPCGSGNITPNAEFNFWVDPEAAQDVIQSGIPIELTPLNVTCKTNFTKAMYDQIVAANTPLTNLIRETMGPGFARYPNRHREMYDELMVAAAIDPSLVKLKQMYVDVDINHGPDYGVSVGAMKPWEGGEDAKPIFVQYDVDNARFVKMFVERLTRK